MRLLHRVIAGFAALAVLFALMIGPMILYRLAVGAPLEGPGPDWQIWLVVAGGGVGAGAARLVHLFLLEQVFGFSSREEERSWHGKRGSG